MNAHLIHIEEELAQAKDDVIAEKAALLARKVAFEANVERYRQAKAREEALLKQAERYSGVPGAPSA